MLALEIDRLVVVTLNEVDADGLPHAPQGLRHLPAYGVMQVATRRATNAAELLESVNLGLSGISSAMRPS